MRNNVYAELAKAFNEILNDSMEVEHTYVNNRFTLLESNIANMDNRLTEYVDSMIRIQQIAIRHLYDKIALLEDELDKLKKEQG